MLAAFTRAGSAYFARADGAGHEKPFGYYTWLVAENGSGAMVCALAYVGVWRTLRERPGSVCEFLVVYAVAIGLLYCVISYKTPWLALNFWLPLVLLAGLGVDGLWHGLRESLKKSTLAVGVVWRWFAGLLFWFLVVAGGSSIVAGEPLRGGRARLAKGKRDESLG